MSKQAAIHQTFDLSSKWIDAISLPNALFYNYTLINVKRAIHMSVQLLNNVSLIDTYFKMPDFSNLLLNFVVLTVD